MLRAIKCFIGIHDWRIAAEIDAPGSGFTDDPADYECGGVDYHIRCAHCPRAYVDRKRGVWITPKYPRLSKGLR